MAVERIDRRGMSPRNVVIRELRKEIEQGRLAVGDPVPSERALTRPGHCQSLPRPPHRFSTRNTPLGCGHLWYIISV